MKPLQHRALVSVPGSEFVVIARRRVERQHCRATVLATEGAVRALCHIASCSQLAYALCVRALVGLLLFLVFVDDDECAYKAHFGAPMGWANTLIEPTAIKIRPVDLILVAILIAASITQRNKVAYTKPMK